MSQGAIIDLHITVRITDTAAGDDQLQTVIALMGLVIKDQTHMSVAQDASLAALREEVSKVNTVASSAVTLLEGVIQQLHDVAASDDISASLDELTASLTAGVQPLADAVSQGTPNAPPTPVTTEPPEPVEIITPPVLVAGVPVTVAEPITEPVAEPVDEPLAEGDPGYVPVDAEKPAA